MLRKRIKAFTLIEIMVVIALLGFMAAIVLPRMTRKPPSAEWKNILDDINNVVLFKLHEGTEFRVREIKENWLKIELVDGKKGWIKKAGADII